MKRTKLLLIAMAVWVYGYAQETHVIEPQPTSFSVIIVIGMTV